MDLKPILLVEDNPADVYFTQRFLTRSHFANPLLVAEDGEKAMEYLSGGELPVLVLLDLKLPKIDGIEVLRRIRSQKRTMDLPVVIMTGYDRDKNEITGRGLGISGYLPKPVVLAGFVKALTDLGLQLAVLDEVSPSKSKDGCD